MLQKTPAWPATRAPCPNLHVTADANLPSEYHAIADAYRSGDPHLRHEETQLPDMDVVPDVDEVVDLGAIADDGIIDTPTIDGAVGPDLDVVSDETAPDMWNLFMRPITKDVSESIAPDSRPRVHDAACPDFCPRVQRDVANRCVVRSPIVTPSPIDGIFVDADPFTETDVSP